MPHAALRPVILVCLLATLLAAGPLWSSQTTYVVTKPSPDQLAQGFVLEMPGQLDLGDMLIVRLRPVVDLKRLLPPLLSAKMRFVVTGPRGGQKTFGPFDLSMDGASGISYTSFEDRFAEVSVTEGGEYKVEAQLVLVERVLREEFVIPFPARRVTAGTGGSVSDDDPTGTGGGQAAGTPTGEPLNTEYAQIMIQTREGAPFIEEDRRYTFTADMSKVKFSPPVSTGEMRAAHIEAARQELQQKYFNADKRKAGTPFGLVPSGDERLGGGVDGSSFLYRWIVKDPQGNPMPGGMVSYEKAITPPLPPPPQGGQQGPPPPLACTVPDFPFTFDHPTEPKKASVSFLATFDLLHFEMSYQKSNCQLVEKDAADHWDQFEKKILDELRDNQEPLIDPPPRVIALVEPKNQQSPVTFTARGLVEYHTRKTRPVELPNGEFAKKPNGEVIMAVQPTRNFHPKPANYKGYDVASFTIRPERQANKEARMLFPVFDTTAPEIRFVTEESGDIQALGDYKVTTGDLRMVRVWVKDNNRYARIRTPYLYYETEPSAGRKETWCGAPLRMETIDGIGPPPYMGERGNDFRWQAFVPAPHNYIGARCVKWYVDAYDGSSHPRFQAKDFMASGKRAGNHNRGKLNYETRPGEWEILSEEVGTFSIYDNDRPNITVKMYEVREGKPVFLDSFSAAEDWRTPDFHTDINPSGAAFAGIIPDDGILASSGYLPTGSIMQFYMNQNPELKARILADQPLQVADAGGVRFHFKTAESGPAVVFEDKHYLFAFDIDDNVDWLASGTGVQERKDLEKFERLKWQLFDPESKIRMDSPAELRFAGGRGDAEGWYLGPRDPEVDGIKSKQEIPMYEHVFHVPKNAAGDGPRPYMRFAVTDKQGHERWIKISFNVIDVKTEFRNLEGKVERNRERDRR